jgi:hypothetical protein
MTILLHNGNYREKSSISKQNCHPDRSAAEWRDLLFHIGAQRMRRGRIASGFRFSINANCRSLRYPGFPVELSGVGALHAAFHNESSTRGCVRRRVAGNPGPVGMTNLRLAAYLGSGEGGGTESNNKGPHNYQQASLDKYEKAVHEGAVAMLIRIVERRQARRAGPAAKGSAPPAARLPRTGARRRRRR